MAAATTPTDPSATLNRNLPSKNPLPLSASQETQVRDLYYKRVRSYCSDEIKEFADCARNRTFSATWLCRDQRQAMNRCMVAHASQAELDRARDEWFATAGDRRRQREAEEAERAEKLRQKRQYWGVDETGRPLEKSKAEPKR